MRNLIVASLLILPALPLAAQGPANMARDSWTGPITPGSTIRVVNPHGDVRLRHGGTTDNLEAAVIFQQLAADGSRLVLDVEVSDEVAQVSIIRLGPDGEPSTAIPRGDKARADLAVMVPAGHPVEAVTARGLLEAQGVRGDLDLRSDGGTIRAAKINGALTTENGTGVTEITLEPGVTKHRQRFKSASGPVTVFVSPDSDLDVSMATSGTLTTDFTLNVENHDHEEPNKTATAVVGRGGPHLVLASTRGDLALRRLATVD